MTEHVDKIVVSLKADAPPWVTVHADSAGEAVSLLGQADMVAQAATAAARAVQAAWNGAPALKQEAGANPAFVAQQNVGDGWTGQPLPVQQQPQQPVQQQAPAQQNGVETDRWNNTYTHNHPQAPLTQFGPKVLKFATSAQGKPYRQWLDPRDPRIPSVYQRVGKNAPPDLIEPEFAARGVV